jgi:hypothetical protein
MIAGVSDKKGVLMSTAKIRNSCNLSKYTNLGGYMTEEKGMTRANSQSKFSKTFSKTM